MKKKIALLLIGALFTVSLVACGNENETNTNDTEPSTSEVSTEQSSEAEPVETITLADVVVEDYVTIDNYKGLEISYSAKETFTQEDVDALALSAYSGYITEEAGGIKDRAAAIGDIVNIDYVGVMDGVAFDGGSASGADLELGSGSFIDGFEDGLVGVMPGETVDLNIAFPDPYENNPDLAGKPVTFTVTVNFIYPIIDSVDDMQDDVLAALNYEEYSTVEEFRAFCLEYFEYSTEENYKVGKQNAALNALLAVATVQDAPAGLVQYYYDSAYESIEMQAAQYGFDVETFCYYFFGGDATTVATMIASENAKSAILLQYIANIENLNVDDAELEVLIEEFAKENNSTVEEVTSNADRELLREYFMNEKVFDFILANGNCTEVPVE
ncbi:MAG: FKBP-type peptidyl-prolyl cis-trans isomerase [Lachnospiraceae bacterium]|nr:FKBP-type peptidyl-prolyl cis-trans isomerase [Lachnospiraceae bacterium]